WDLSYFVGAGRPDPGRYVEQMTAEGRSVAVYYPAYFQTMAVRLHAFEGRAVEPRGSVWVILRQAPGAGGNPQPRLVSAREFEDYESASNWRALQWKTMPDADLRIAS